MRVKRARAHAAVVATVAAWVFVVAAVTTGLIGYLVVASQDGVREALRDAPPAQAAVQAVTRLGADPADQDAAVRAAVDDRSGGAPLAVHRSLAGGEDALTVPGSDEDARGVLVAYEDLEQHAELASGEWPEPISAAAVGDTETALHATAAEALGLTVGDEITVGEVRVVVTGTWLPADPADPFWFGEPLEVTGVDGSAYGPFVVTEDSLTAVEASPRARWRITPLADEITPGQVDGLAAALPGLPGALEDDRIDVNGVAISGDLAATAAALDADVDRGASVSAVPLVVLVAVAVVAGAQVARLLGVVREIETTLLRSRGLSAAQLVWWSVLESVAVVLPAATLGAAATVLALRAGGGPEVGAGVAAWCAAGVAAGTLALLVTGAVATARRRVEDTVAFTSRRATGAIGWTFAAVALIAAAVAIWQLRRYGSGSGASDSSSADLLATPGPALALLACAAIALLAVPFPLALAEKALAGRRRLGLLLPAWQVTRRLPVYASVVVLVVVTAGAGVLAASYSATWTGLQEDLADVRSGADVRVTFDRAGPLTAARPAESATPFGQVGGAGEAVGVLSAGARIGDESAALLAMPAAGLGTVVETRDDVFPAARVAADVTPEQAPLIGLELPEGSERLEVDTTGVAAATLLLADVDGVLAQAVVENGVAAVPAGFGTLVAADLTLAATGASEVAVTELRAAGASGPATVVPLDGAGPWAPQVEASYRIDEAEPGTVSPLSAATVAFQPGGKVRVTPQAVTDQPVPVVASQAAMDRFGLRTGDPVTMHLVGSRVDLLVTGTVPVVPGVADPVAFVADLPSITSTLLRTADLPQRISEVWLRADGGTADLAAAAEAAGLTGAAQLTDRETVRSELLDHGLARHVVPAFWSVAAAAVVLTAIGAVASAATLRRQRRGELAVLRVVGVAPSEQARSRRIEQAGMGVLAMVAGAAGGLLVAALTVTVLARAATSGVPEALDPVAGASLGALALFGVVLTAVVAAVALLQASRAGHDAAVAMPGEERR
ncbi:hypothetical protein [Jiangella anatolica]|uniref:ABC3 transporter permease protein domain-containing protein n=1 Tax=Jiangella anatolica TaxID=2670374 RepID=A0A2W2CCG7_9ACTN|nr:hypothetical protein [Jiangella anatolica]PZF85929.1 hypothetical protein C1I92_03375 [Jiangella anatolica]